MNADHLGDEAIRLRLLRLALLHGGRVALKDLKPAIDAPSRRRLEDRNLLERDCFTTDARGRSVKCLALTDAGWRWLSENFAGDVSRSSQCGRELAAILGMMRRLLAQQNLTFGEAVAAHVSARTQPPVSSHDDTRLQIRSAHQALSRNTGLERVRLADMRARLTHLPRPVFDEAIRTMEATDEVVLYRLDNPLEIREEDRLAAILTPTGQPRHLVYMKDPR